MNIAYASDDNFVDVMLVSIMSFNDHNSDATIYVMDCGITEHNKQKILELCSDKNTVLFVDAKKILDGIGYDLNLDRGSIASYARLFIGSMIPRKVEKIIYIDSDTLICESLRELFDTELAPYVIGGIRDSFSVANKKVFGLKKGDLFINAGVLLIDLKKWRNEDIEKKIVELLDKKHKIFQGDQGVINAIFHGTVFELPLKFDVMTYLYDFTYEQMMMYRKPDNYFDKEYVLEATSFPAIVHFSSSFYSYRPWEKGTCEHPYYEKWNEYYEKLQPIKMECNRVVKKQKWRFFLLAIRIVHAYIRPMLVMIKEYK